MITYLVRSLVLASALFLLPGIAAAQFCNPATVSYLVRDEKGKLLNSSDLKLLVEKLPQTVGNAKVDTGEVSFKDDMQHYYWSDSTEWSSGKKVAALEFVNASTCTMTLPDATLVYRGKKMRLIFDITIERKQDDRRIVIDAPSFRAGTYRLDLKGWSRDPETMIPAKSWKRN
jgi:hypothetical protein